VLTDVGSTKLDICAATLDVLGAGANRFVAGHPIAGGEASGVDAGNADLFDDGTSFYVPTLTLTRPPRPTRSNV